ncbi:FMN-binding protein [Desulfitobacterium hafniense]|uniref:FMN-binding protein n=1 Tax=Desulfitobacterium hafniense TaxID=49338 RepID=UPI00037FD083|nr:FMN-binding protein [Desulfitobacterium hafniense]
MRKSKLFTLIGIVVSVMFLVAACGTSEDTGIYKDGTYEGISNKGIQPGLKVSVTIKDDKITDVTVTENGETEGVGSRAIDELPGKIVEAQSTEVEAISGASLSSAAIKEAVDLALEQAKK